MGCTLIPRPPKACAKRKARPESPTIAGTTAESALAPMFTPRSRHLARKKSLRHRSRATRSGSFCNNLTAARAAAAFAGDNPTL